MHDPDGAPGSAASAGTAPHPFAGSVALITGSSQRLGAALARALAARGLTIAVHYRRSAEPARALVEEIERDGGRAAAFAADLDDPAQAEALFAAVREKLGAPRVLVHNASRYEPIDLAGATIEEVRRDLAVHVESPIALSRAFAAALAEEGGAAGRIVCLLDWRATIPDPTVLPYAIAKGGLHALVRNLAVALGPSVTVNGVAPGAVLPASSETGPPETEEDLDRRATGLPIERPGRVEDVIEACCFFIDGAHYTTGAVLPVDGGRHLL